ncbi:MAG: class I adenylate cyclase [Deltaproteobacteria bacterium]|jgi:adenylate cyclase class 1|nr:class I adenylate cyclase [Deltaproteobacteria bacterium]
MKLAENSQIFQDLPKDLEPYQEAQDRNNQARYRELRSMATPGFLQVFNLAPTLLHYNHPQLPGYLDKPEVPCGICFYDDWLAQTENLPVGPWLQTENSEPVVESLVLIGSSGSVGHTERSDLDYWVCYNPEHLKDRALENFKEKLQAITHWAQRTHNTEANFYLVNLAELSEGRLEHSLGKGADGEVAPHLLMEELYRTILYVAGRFPLWCVWPLDRSKEEYFEAAEILAPLDWEKTPTRYVNLGFPSKAEPQEYLASAMWLMCKAEADPFKGVIKLLPILEAVETDFESPLLCDLVKNAIFNNYSPFFSVDPYIITIDRVIAYSAKNISPEHLELVRMAAALKVLGLSDPGDEPERIAPGSHTKLRVLTRWIDEWGWPPDKLAHLASYTQWAERERLTLGNDILMMLLGVYMRVSSHLINRFPGQVNAQDEELAPFAARILNRQRGLDATVDLLPSELLRQSLSRRMLCQQDLMSGRWAIYALPPTFTGHMEALNFFSPPDEGDLIFEADRLAKAAAWLVRNELVDDELELTVGDSFGATAETIMNFLAALNALFPPVEFHNLEIDTLWQVGAKGPILIAFNLEDPGEIKLRTIDLIYRTGWGEMRHEWKDLGRHPVEADKYLDISGALTESCGASAVDSLVLFPAQADVFSRAFNTLKASLRSRQRPKHQLKSNKSLIDL